MVWDLFSTIYHEVWLTLGPQAKSVSRRPAAAQGENACDKHLWNLKWSYPSYIPGKHHVPFLLYSFLRQLEISGFSGFKLMEINIVSQLFSSLGVVCENLWSPNWIVSPMFWSPKKSKCVWSQQIPGSSSRETTLIFINLKPSKPWIQFPKTTVLSCFPGRNVNANLL